MRNVRVARRYASALMAAGEEGKSLEAIARDLETVGRIVETSREFQLMLRSPVISPPKKIAVMQELFESRVGRETIIFMKLLVQKNREGYLPDVIEQFRALMDEKQGLVRIELTSAVTLSQDQEQRLKGKLEEYTGKRVRFNHVLDRSIMGGIVVRIGDTVLDGSVTHQLALLRERMAEGTSVQ